LGLFFLSFFMTHSYHRSLALKRVSVKLGEDHTLTVDLPMNEVELLGDKRRLQQIIINLMSNAIKFTHHGGIKVILKGNLDQEDIYQISLVIHDTGIGISPEDRDKLFLSFSQVDASISRQYGGTGLGLSISSHLLDMMGGHIDVTSKLGTGSQFAVNIALPIHKQQEPLSSDTKKEVKEELVKKVIPLNILVAEDNLINQKLIKAYLKKLGYRPTMAGDGEEACQLCRLNQYDLIFMDLQMPVMGGIDATRTILEESQKAPIIVAMTANVFEEDKRKSFEAGMSDFLSKPVRLNSIEKVISEFFG